MIVQFENPALLHLLWILPLHAIMLFAYWRWRKRTLRQLGTPALEARLLQGFSPWRFWTKNALFATATTLVVLALVNPQRMVRKDPPPQESSDVIIALDVSNSMLARDVAPDRLGRAKAFARELISALDGERIALVFFAGEAFPQTPLSLDHQTAAMFVHNANPDFVINQGSDLADALLVAGRLFDPRSPAGKAIVLVSDGENHGPDAVVRAAELRRDGVMIHTVGVGTRKGERIPDARTKFHRAPDGGTVQTKMDPILLSELARQGGGLNLQINEDPGRAVRDIAAAVADMEKETIERQAYTDKQSYFQWLVLPALLLLIFDQTLWWRKKAKS